MRSIRSIPVLAALALVVSCNRDPKVLAQRYVEAGNRYYNTGKIAQARLMYIRAKQKDLRNGDAYYRWGLSELKLNNYAAAVGAFQRAIELIPPTKAERWDAIVKASDIYLLAAHQERDARNQKQYLDDVERWSSELLKHDPNSFDAHRVSGDFHLAKSVIARKIAQKAVADGELEESILEYQKADTLKPGDISIWMQLARSLTSKPDVAAAEQFYKKVIEKDKTFQPAYGELYRIYLSQDKTDIAEQLLKQAFLNNPKDVQYLTMLATQYSLQRRAREMEAVLAEIKSRAAEYPDAYLVLGEFRMKQGSPDEAIKEYREGMARDPQRKTEYQKHVMEVMLQQGRRNEAAELNQQILKEKPADPDARGLAAMQKLEKGEIAKAITELQAVVTAAPENPVLRYDLGKAWEAKGEMEQARQAFDKAIELKSDYLLPRLALARLQLSKGEYDASYKSADAILSQFDSTNGPAHLIVTASLIGQRKYQEARATLEALAKKNANVPELQLQFGTISMAERKFADAEAAFRKAYQLNPNDSRGIVGMVESYFLQNKGDQALKMLQAEVDKAPTRWELRIALGNAELDMHQYDQAIADYQKVLAGLDKDSVQRAGVYLRMGEAYRQKGDRATAVANLQKAREAQPDNTTILTNLAVTLEEAGRTSESRQVYETALKVDPNNALVLNNLAYLLAEHGGDLNDALTKALKAKQLLPNLAEASDTLGWIYLKKGLNDNAVDVFKELVTKAPGQPLFRMHLGMALLQKGDKIQAAKELRETLKYNPTKDDQTKIQELLAKASA